MYQYEAHDYANEFFQNQEQLKNSRAQRQIAQAQELRAQSLFSRQQEVQAVTDETLQTLARFGSGQSSSTEKAVNELASDVMSGTGNDDVFQKVVIDEKPRSIRVEPMDLSIGKMADAVGSALMKAGYGSEGMDYVKAGMEFTAKVAEIEEKRAAGQIKRAQDFIKIADFVYEGMADVRSQEDQDAFLNSLPDEIVSALGPENVEAMRQIPFSPEVIKHYRDQALSTKETYELNMKAEDQQFRADRDAAMEFDRIARRKLAAQKLEDARIARENKEKGAGKNAIITAQPGEISQANTKIIAEVFKGVAPTKGSPDAIILQSAAASIASEAKQMAKDNPGLTYDQALSRAVVLHRADFIRPVIEKADPGRYIPVIGYEFGKKPAKHGALEYKPRGDSQERPIVLKSRESAGKMVPGKWYSFNGRTMQYNP